MQTSLEKLTNWREAKWGDVKILCDEDNKNWYYKFNNQIYVQAKQGDHTPHCYECNSEIKFKPQHCSVHFKEFKLTGGGEVRIKHIPYCPECEKEPAETGFITE